MPDCFYECTITAPGNIFLNALGIITSAVAKNYPFLMCKKGKVVHERDSGPLFETLRTGLPKKVIVVYVVMEYAIQQWLNLFLSYIPEEKLVFSRKLDTYHRFVVGRTDTTYFY